MSEEYIILEGTTAGKDSWVIWKKPENSRVYSEQVARTYDIKWAERLIALLNGEPDGD